MRVAFQLPGTLDGFSGGYFYDRLLVQHLLRAGDPVSVISLPTGGYGRQMLGNAQLGILYAVRRANPDVIIQDELGHPSLAWLNHLLRRTSRAPILALVHHLRSSEDAPTAVQRRFRAFERAYLQTVHGIICNSRATRRSVFRLLGRPVPAIVAPPGAGRLTPTLDQHGVAERAARAGPLRLILVGNLIPRKGVHLLIESLKLLAANTATAAIIGSPDVDPAYARKLNRQARGAANRVAFRGRIGDAELAAALARSDVMISAASYEGYGMAALEGMGFGLPLVAADAGGIREVVTHDVSGLLIPPNNSIALAVAIDALARNRGLLRRLSLGALDRYQQQPSWDDSMATIRAALHRQFWLPRQAATGEEAPKPAVT